MTEQEAARQRELALMIELAPKLNEYRENWQIDDGIYDMGYKQSGFIVELAGDHTEYMESRLISGLQIQYRFSDKMLIWIPKSIDSADPERIARGEKPRGLWGMVDWGWIPYINNWGMLKLVTRRREIWHDEYKAPTEALLLCLREQFKEGR